MKTDTAKPIVPILVSSREHAAFATRRVILQLSALRNHLTFAGTASRKVHSKNKRRNITVAHFILGHKVTECTENRVIDDSAIETKTAEAAWDGLKAADRERDLDEFREALKIYHKAEPSADWQSLERAFRTQDCNVYLIGYVSTLSVLAEHGY